MRCDYWKTFGYSETLHGNITIPCCIYAGAGTLGKSESLARLLSSIPSIVAIRFSSGYLAVNGCGNAAAEYGGGGSLYLRIRDTRLRCLETFAISTSVLRLQRRRRWRMKRQRQIAMKPVTTRAPTKKIHQDD